MQRQCIMKTNKKEFLKKTILLIFFVILVGVILFQYSIDKEIDGHETYIDGIYSDGFNLWIVRSQNVIADGKYDLYRMDKQREEYITTLPQDFYAKAFDYETGVFYYITGDKILYEFNPVTCDNKIIALETALYEKEGVLAAGQGSLFTWNYSSNTLCRYNLANGTKDWERNLSEYFGSKPAGCIYNEHIYLCDEFKQVIYILPVVGKTTKIEKMTADMPIYFMCPEDDYVMCVGGQKPEATFSFLYPDGKSEVVTIWENAKYDWPETMHATIHGNKIYASVATEDTIFSYDLK